MRQVNCIFPLRIRISGQLADADLDSLSDAVTSEVRSRLRFAREILVSHLHAEAGPALLNQPTVAFKGDYLSRDSQSRIEQIVRQAIERGSSSGDLPGVAPHFLLAQYKPGISQPATSPIKKTARKKAAGTRLMIAPGQENVFGDALRNVALSLDRTQRSGER